MPKYAIPRANAKLISGRCPIMYESSIDLLINIGLGELLHSEMPPRDLDTLRNCMNTVGSDMALHLMHYIGLTVTGISRRHYV